MKYLPIIRQQDIALKNDGKQIIFKIRGQEYEFKRNTIKEFMSICDYILSTNKPTGWITGAQDIKQDTQENLWTDDKIEDDMP